jgi:hypothetical protein
MDTVEIGFPIPVDVPQHFYDRVEHVFRAFDMEVAIKVLGDPTKDTISKIEIMLFKNIEQLPELVSFELGILLGAVCAGYSQDHPDQIMWMDKYGTKSEDGSVFFINMAVKSAKGKGSVCSQCGAAVKVKPESQASCLLVCTNPQCRHEDVVLF